MLICRHGRSQSAEPVLACRRVVIPAIHTQPVQAESRGRSQRVERLREAIAEDIRHQGHQVRRGVKQGTQLSPSALVASKVAQSQLAQRLGVGAHKRKVRVVRHTALDVVVPNRNGAAAVD